ncbi:MAG: helix-turn-helix transcriptional regulator [Lachnospiraceae bacterium]|nr:helix-turn-helix transcriptional regulator [Lachnospiraceae bacterium]
MLLIGAKIQEYRKKQGLSQEEFAAEVGVTRQAVSKWETDKAYPDLDKLVTICDILQIDITELIYGEIVATFEDSAEHLPERPGAAAEPLSEMKGIAVEKVRGRKVYLQLWVTLALIGGMFLFCGAFLVTTLTHYSWKKEDALAEHVRVERVHQQYTKADVSFFDDVSRRVVKTVWLDINGIREGDSLICYTDGEQKGIYYEYHGATLFVLAAVELVFLFLFLIIVGEFKRLVRENRWHVAADGVREKGV